MGSDRPEPFSGQPDEQEQEDRGPWLLRPPAAHGDYNPTASGEHDPVLPSLIELSMFQDPDSAGDPAGEQGAEEAPETDEAEAAWLAAEAWPSPAEGGRSPQPGFEPPAETAGEKTVLIEHSWFQEDQVDEQPPVKDWTAPDTPWPGETRRPEEPPSWADEMPAAQSRLPAPEPGSPAAAWGEDPWIQQQRLQPPAGHEPEDLAVAQSRREAQLPPREDFEDPAHHRQPQPPPEVPGSQPWGEDSWLKEPAPNRPQEKAAVRDEAWARANPPDEIDDDFKPLSIEINHQEPPAPDPIAQAAIRLKAAREAIKVDNGLAYVLVDDEGRPVLR